jgi:hypothetical protein
MYARVAKPKLSLKIAAPSSVTTSLKSPVAAMSMARSPMSPVAMSPTAINTARNVRLTTTGFSSFEQPSYSYNNSSNAKSILKRQTSSRVAVQSGKRIQFKGEPVVHPITPIEDPEYYGSHVKMSKDDRRWSRLSQSSSFRSS